MFFNYLGSPINAGAIAMLVGMVVVPVVSLITPKLKQETVDEIFMCLDEKVVVERKMALPNEESVE